MVSEKMFYRTKVCLRYEMLIISFLFMGGQSTEVHAMGDGAMPTVITAHARNLESEDTGYSFVHCTISGTGSTTFLGRAWMDRPKVVFSHTYMSSVVNPLGWSNNLHPDRDS